MTTIFSIMLALVLSHEGLVLEPELTMEPVPETEAYMTGASNAVMDRQGNIYVLDPNAGKVFTWDQRGRYLRNFGGKGQGPGEFSFDPFRGLFGYLGISGDQVLVYDTAVKRLTFFDKTGNFLKMNHIQAPPGSIFNFFIPSEGRFILDIQDRAAKPLMRNVSLYDFEGNRLEELVAVPDETYEQVVSGGKLTSVIFKIFQATLGTSFNETNHRLIYGLGSQKRLQIIDMENGIQSAISFEIRREPVTEADIDEHGLHRWIKDNPLFVSDYAEEKPYFQQILDLGDSYLLANISPYYRNLRGVLMDLEGNIIGEVRYPLGESGILHNSQGRLIYTGMDQAGEVVVRRMRIKPAGGIEVGLR